MPARLWNDAKKFSKHQISKVPISSLPALEPNVARKYMSSPAVLSSRKRDHNTTAPADDEYRYNKKVLLNGLTSLCLDTTNSGVLSPPQPGDLTENLVKDINIKECERNVVYDFQLDDSDDDHSVKSFSEERSDELLGLLTGHGRKYGRTVDILEDELIRKSQRLHSSTTNKTLEDMGDPELFLPNSIGPHPLQDRALGMLWPTIVPTQSGNAAFQAGVLSNSSIGSFGNQQRCSKVVGRSLHRADSDSSSSMEECVDATLSLACRGEDSVDACDNGDTMQAVTPPSVPAPAPAAPTLNLLGMSGTITHGDWGIEDVSASPSSSSSSSSSSSTSFMTSNSGRQ
jgi:hypothetical protein